MRRVACLAALLSLTWFLPGNAQSTWTQLQPLYEDLHAHPELSFQETATAAKLAETPEGARLRGDDGRRAARASSAC